jgi:hypothetical protein
LTAYERVCTGVEVIDSITDAIAASIARTGDPAVVMIPEGPYVIPQYAAEAAELWRHPRHRRHQPPHHPVTF